MQRLKVNEIKISTSDRNVFVVIAVYAVIVGICAAVVCYYRGADNGLERELANIERLNNQLASETRRLQAGIASHVAGIAGVRKQVSKSRERIEHVYTDLETAGSDADGAIEVIADCQKILEKVKTQR
jgi:peptidoglycan hydrolase CwlO-like protein